MLPGDSSTPLLVSYSGGKDSLAVMDLCVRAGRRVEAFMLAFLPGMDFTAHWIEYAQKRWGVQTHEFLDPGTIQYLRRGVFRAVPLDIPAITTRDIEAEIRARTGIEWIGYGYKQVDCIDRRVMLKTWPDGNYEPWKKFAPCKTWRHSDVLAYLSRHRIEIPVAIRAGMNGIGLSPQSLEWLRREWPGDYRRVLEVFPFAQAQADRAIEFRTAKERARKAGARAHRQAFADQPGGIQPA